MVVLEREPVNGRKNQPSSRISSASKKLELFGKRHDPEMLRLIIIREKSAYADFVKQFVYFLFKENSPDANQFFMQNTRSYQRSYLRMYADFVVPKHGKNYLEGILKRKLTDKQYALISKAITILSESINHKLPVQ